MEIQVGDLAFQLHDPGSEPALFAGKRLAIAYRGAANPPLLRALVRRLRHAEQDGTLVDALEAALKTWRPVVGMRDTDFRNVSDTEAIIRVGFRCNQDCGFCWQGRDWPGPSTHPHPRTRRNRSASRVHLPHREPGGLGQRALSPICRHEVLRPEADSRSYVKDVEGSGADSGRVPPCQLLRFAMHVDQIVVRNLPDAHVNIGRQVAQCLHDDFERNLAAEHLEMPGCRELHPVEVRQHAGRLEASA
jgi:hypothetical protein